MDEVIELSFKKSSCEIRHSHLVGLSLSVLEYWLRNIKKWNGISIYQDSITAEDIKYEINSRKGFKLN